jgi:alpha-L-rhamnosidase
MNTRSCLVALLLAFAPLASAAAGATGPSLRPWLPEEPLAGARWIAPPRMERPVYSSALFRKSFNLERLPRRATLRIIGLGDYDPSLNGRRLAPLGINQPWSQYERTLYYREFDVSRWLQRGSNCLGVVLTHSFWDNAPAPKGRYFKDGPQRQADEPLLLCAELDLVLADGTTERLGTDGSWQTHAGPVTFSHIFGGEDFDARRVLAGWDTPRFNAAQWTAAREVAAPAATLLPQAWPPVEPRERFQPVKVSEPAPGVWMYQFPQNCAAQLRVKVSGGKPGDRVSFRCGEHKNEQDRLFGHYTVGCDLITAGAPLTHQWVSFYLGMQFVEVTGAVPTGRPNPEGLPVLESLELVHVRTGLATAGTFTSSSPVLNGTHRIVDWAMQANAQHVMTDCPHREKLGWLECAYLLAPSFLYRYDSDAVVAEDHSATSATRRNPRVAS